MDKSVLAALVIFVACAIIVLSAVFYAATPEEKPHVDLVFKWSTLEANVTQGGKARLNCTVFNTDYNYSINAGFTTSLSGFNHLDSAWARSDEPRIFNATFNPWVMNQLQPRETRTTFLTVEFADDAPIGTYQFALQGFNNTLNVNVQPKL